MNAAGPGTSGARQWGFTLLEAIVTLVIVSLLVTILMQALGQAMSLRTRLLRFDGENRVAGVAQLAGERRILAGRPDRQHAAGA